MAIVYEVPPGSEPEKLNIFRKFWNTFNQQDRFTKFFFVTAFLILFATPAIISETTNIFSHASEEYSVSIHTHQTVHPFTHNILGLSFPTVSTYKYWAFDEIPGFVQAVKAIQPGVLRFGGSEDSTTGWDKANCHNGVNSWYVNGFHYNRTYCPEIIDDIERFSQAVGAQIVILGINNQDDNLSMWQDFIRYIRIEKKYRNIYFEIGNEPEGISGENSTLYTSQLQAYEKALLQIDPTINIVGPTLSTIQDENSTKTSLTNNVSSYIIPAIQAAHSAGKDLSLLSVHWYKAYHPSLDQTGINQILRYGIYNPNGTPLLTNDWHNILSRRYADIFPNRINSLQAGSPIPPILVDEQNTIGDAGPWTIYDSNYIDALSLSDVLGRLQYNGVYAAGIWTGFSQSPTDPVGIIAPANTTIRGVAPSGIILRPAYYPYLLYSQFFNSEMVQTQTSDPEKLTVWASVDPKNPHTVKLIVTNFTNSYINPAIYVDQFNVQEAKIYTLTSNNPLDLSTSFATNQTVSINGKTIDSMNVLGSLNQIPPLDLPVPSVSNNPIKFLTFAPYSVTSIILSDIPTVISNTPTPISIPSTVPSKPCNLSCPQLPVGCTYIGRVAGCSCGQLTCIKPTVIIASPTIIPPTPTQNPTPTPTPKPVVIFGPQNSTVIGTQNGLSAGNTSWTNYTTSFSLTPTWWTNPNGDSYTGLHIRQADSKDFSLLIIRQTGVFYITYTNGSYGTEHQLNSTSFTSGQSYPFTLVANGNNIQVIVNGNTIGTIPTNFTNGGITIYGYNIKEADYTNILVTSP